MSSPLIDAGLEHQKPRPCPTEADRRVEHGKPQCEIRKPASFHRHGPKREGNIGGPERGQTPVPHGPKDDTADGAPQARDVGGEDAEGFAGYGARPEHSDHGWPGECICQHDDDVGFDAADGGRAWGLGDEKGPRAEDGEHQPGRCKLNAAGVSAREGEEHPGGLEVDAVPDARAVEVACRSGVAGAEGLDVLLEKIHLAW